MIYSPEPIAVALFIFFVLSVIVLSSWLGRRTKSAESYFAAGGTIHWSVNGIAFAGDYLSAASFLGICGMIATSGYDGFLYSIGYLAGWVVALFVVAEPMKRLGKYTFTDALDSKFNSKGIQLMAAISTLIVSMCYLIPQMVGAGVLVTPLLGFPHYVGVIMVGSIVIFIVATAGMASTTYVQFLKGGLLIVFSTVLVIMLARGGLSKKPSDKYHEFVTLTAEVAADGALSVQEEGYKVLGSQEVGEHRFAKVEHDGLVNWWHVVTDGTGTKLEEALSITTPAAGEKLYNGAPKKEGKFYQVGHMSKIVMDGKEVESTGPIGPLKFLSLVNDGEVVRFKKAKLTDGDNAVAVHYQVITPGSEVMRPGIKFKTSKFWDKMNFISLMLALFFGTSALPHILIRYYTVPSARCARKSTIVAISAIGFFYVLTLFMGIGAMVSGVIDVESSNMSAPLLAKLFGIPLFAVISAIAFATILGTVSGLIVAASGAVAHDLMDRFLGIKMTDKSKVMAGKIAAVVVGIIAIVLGIAFKGMNVSFLVGLAFAVAASANLPAILMLLFWKKTTAKGIAGSILVGMVSALTLIMLSPSMFERYGLGRAAAPIPLDNPGIISIPLSFLTLVVISLMTQKKNETAEA